MTVTMMTAIIVLLVILIILLIVVVCCFVGARGRPALRKSTANDKIKDGEKYYDIDIASASRAFTLSDLRQVDLALRTPEAVETL